MRPCQSAHAWRAPCPSCPARLTTLQMLAKKIGQLEKKIAEHERAAGGSLPDLQVGRGLSQPGMFFVGWNVVAVRNAGGGSQPKPAASWLA